MADRLTAIFGQPFAQQLAAWRLRLGELRGTTTWTDVEPQFHDRGFMVAGAMKADLLADLAGAVDQAISRGTSLEDFRRDFRATVARHGWHGWTGEGSLKGEAWRTRTIYRTNLSTTYHAGRRAQLVEGDFAFWIYLHGNAREPRIIHLSWHGWAGPPSHPFWRTHFAPNGWGCTCYIAGARTAAGVRRLGGDPDKPLPPGWDRIDPKTGAPVGIDKGWAYAPGATVDHLVQEMTAKAVNWDYSLSTAYMRGLPRDNVDKFSAGYRNLPSLAADLRRWAAPAFAGDGQPVKVQKSLGLVPEVQMTAIRPMAALQQNADLYDFVVDRDTLRHVVNRHTDPATELSRGQRPVVAADFGRLGQILNAPDAMVPGAAIPRRGPIVRFEKLFGQERQVALFEVRPGRRRLSLVTMWVEVIAGASPTATP